MVGDHVVQFAGDPDALGGGGAPGGRGVEFGLGPLGPLGAADHAVTAGGGVVAGQAGQLGQQPG
jgi:hypothetical protein